MKNVLMVLILVLCLFAPVGLCEAEGNFIAHLNEVRTISDFESCGLDFTFYEMRGYTVTMNDVPVREVFASFDYMGVSFDLQVLASPEDETVYEISISTTVPYERAKELCVHLLREMESALQEYDLALYDWYSDVGTGGTIEDPDPTLIDTLLSGNAVPGSHVMIWVWPEIDGEIWLLHANTFLIDGGINFDIIRSNKEMRPYLPPYF